MNEVWKKPPVSLAAYQALGIALTELPEVTVYGP